jgi:hypothetical protein
MEQEHVSAAAAVYANARRHARRRAHRTDPRRRGVSPTQTPLSRAPDETTDNESQGSATDHEADSEVRVIRRCPVPTAEPTEVERMAHAMRASPPLRPYVPPEDPSDDIPAAVLGPLRGMEWRFADHDGMRTTLGETPYCYMCATLPTAENVFRARMQSIIDECATTSTERLCVLLYSIYTNHVRGAGATVKPDWTLPVIFAHLTSHRPTQAFTLIDSLRITQAMLDEYLRVYSVEGQQRERPDDRATKMVQSLIASRTRLMEKLHGLTARTAIR